MERIGMSQEERDWLDWLKRARDGKMTQRKAAERMGVSDRWVRKLLKRMKREGDHVVVHGLRGRASNRKLAPRLQTQAIEMLKQPDWHDFGPTFASEQLAKRHGIQLSDETLRRWMIAAGLWKSKSRKLQAIHCWRPRRSAFGELVQWDTSEHDWLEGRGEPVRYLVRLIDDASSWSWGRFVERDATPFNMGVLWEYLDKHGRMVEVYTDRDSMFAVPPRDGEGEEERVQADRLTQMGRALRELGIGWIPAYSPQAKGRGPPVDERCLRRDGAWNAAFSRIRIAWSSCCAWRRSRPVKRPMSFWRSTTGRSGMHGSRGPLRISRISIVTWGSWSWPRFCVTPSNA